MTRTLFCIGAITLLAGCDDKDIKTYRVSKETTDSAPQAVQKPMDAPVSSPKEAVAPKTAGPATDFQTPKNWESQPPSSMRLASFLVKGDGGTVADVSLIILGGGAGTTLDNVNRWLGQLGQPPIATDRLSSISQQIVTALGEVTIVDLEGLPQGADAAKDGRILAALVMRKEDTWFFKMRGNAALVKAEKEHFLEWVRSATPGPRPDAVGATQTGSIPSGQMPADATHADAMKATAVPSGQMPADATHADAMKAAAVPSGPMPTDATHADAMKAAANSEGERAQAKIRWEAPKDWKSAPVSGMRYASFTTESATGDKGDISVVMLSGRSGSDLDNVIRWRQQLGLATVTEEELKSLVVRLGNDLSSMSLVDLVAADHRMLAGWLRHGEDAWFFKYTGPSTFVEAEKEKFLGFLRSVKFDN